MAEVEVKNLKNKVVEKLELADEVFNYTARETLVWEAVRAYQAAQRKGTHATKTRAAVRGGGRKPWKQKGTGRARAGSIRSPLWKKGGVTFGPQPRDYEQSFPKKKRRGALKMVLSDKLRNQKLTVIDDFSLESHRTKEFLAVLEKFKLEEKILVVDDRENRNLYLSARNLPGVKSVPTVGLNVYDLLNCRHLLISKRAILALQEALRK
ncbi:MAG: 50S ribosomal protein L4 [Acidobacteria bacterium]|nr:50S ribosomal protein L4 [Acidobacteriota bacterium]